MSIIETSVETNVDEDIHAPLYKMLNNIEQKLNALALKIEEIFEGGVLRNGRFQHVHHVKKPGGPAHDHFPNIHIGPGRAWGVNLTHEETMTPAMRRRVRHELKTHPEEFAAVCRGHMKFQLRRDDRAIGYTGQELLVRVDYVMPADIVRQLIHPLLEPDEMDKFVIMSVSLIP